MPAEFFDRRRLIFHPLAERRNKVQIERDHVSPDTPPPPLPAETTEVVEEVVSRLRRARDRGTARMLAFGAHTIKNGLAPVLIDLIEHQWLTHLATNGAGIIHDWEFAFAGASSEDVRENMVTGRFGAWEETGRYVNLALAVGAHEGLGYGEAVGKFVEEEGLTLPTSGELESIWSGESHATPDSIAAAADLLALMQANALDSGRLSVAHPYKRYGLQAAAYRLGVRFTGHPMFGHDIIYEHPFSSGAAIGRTAERDFLSFVASVANLEGGVYLSIGSAVMSPMVFEKSLSMARNLAQQENRRIEDVLIVVVDLTPSTWDWTQGEPPETHAEYYLRYNKSFSRMGCDVRYLTADNRDFLLALVHALRQA